MIAQTIQQLHELLGLFDVSKRIFMDCETTSFDDDVEAFKPYFGHRATLIILGQVGVGVHVIPLRHRTDGHRCIERLDEAKKIIAEWATTVTCLANLNLKFDLHFCSVDGILFPNARMEETGVLARIVYNEHMSYSLANLCKFYNVQAKADEFIKEWKAANKDCKDYGKIPFDTLVPYGIGDVESAMELHYLLLGKLPDECKPVWEIECALTPILFESERDGVQVDIKFMYRKKLELLQSILSKATKINELSGIQNPSSGDEYGAYFMALGFQSNKKTEKGNDSWNKDVLDYISSLGQDTPHKVAKLLYQYSKDEIAESMFCTGWLKHLDPSARIHANVMQAGTVSLRSSSREPNVQNLPKWLMEAIIIEPGHVGIAWDLSQIEYRLFAHYANDPEIIAKYAANPKIDYHQILADKLGIPRNPTKRINFGILYGMGKGKTTATLRNEIIEHDSSELREHLYATYYDPSEDVPPLDTPIPQSVLVTIADNILKEYHAQNPQIKEMQGQIKGLLRQRGYVRSYYGTHFHLDVAHAYVGLNRVIQGTAATLFKKKIVELFTACKQNGIAARLKLQIHDAVYASVPIASANTYVALAHKIVTDCPFRVPVLMDFEAAIYNWKNKIKIKHTDDVLQEVGKICSVKSNYQHAA